MLDLNKLYLMDCMEGMKEFPDNYFELAIVDPPYGIGMSKGTFTYSKDKNITAKRNYTAKGWDNEIPTSEYFKELQRISKNQIICGGNYFTHLLPESRGWIVWDKKIINSSNNNFSDCELLWTSFDRIIKKFTYDWIGFGYLNSTERGSRQHPTQKPVALYKWLLRNYANEGDKILDTHVGSGSSIIAFIDGGFDWIGFEIDEDYHKAATKRIEQHKSQLRMAL